MRDLIFENEDSTRLEEEIFRDRRDDRVELPTERKSKRLAHAPPETNSVTGNYR